jgi:hypothetical protein
LSHGTRFLILFCICFVVFCFLAFFARAPILILIDLQAPTARDAPANVPPTASDTPPAVPPIAWKLRHGAAEAHLPRPQLSCAGGGQTTKDWRGMNKINQEKKKSKNQKKKKKFRF